MLQVSNKYILKKTANQIWEAGNDGESKKNIEARCWPSTDKGCVSKIASASRTPGSSVARSSGVGEGGASSFSNAS
jgi:hypothetical protein